MSKYLGQHFLINQSAINKIIAALDLQPNDTIIEIGPGRGALTLPLVQKCSMFDVRCKIIAIEKDPRLANQLTSYADATINELEIVTGDALKILPIIIKQLANPDGRQGLQVKIVGNIPYYITGKLLRLLGDLITNYKLPITNIVLTIQKEVAERIIANPPRMNLLAAAVQIWAEPEIISYLKAKDFSPPPKVESAIIKLSPKFMRSDLVNYYKLIKNYYKLIKLVFKQPRKTLLNNLSTGLKVSKEKALKMLQEIGLNGNERPQNLSLSQVLQISRLLQ